MPEASDELRNTMGVYFGDRINDQGPTTYLEAAGWKQTSTGFWQSPRPLAEVTAKEYQCVKFLIDEWDHDYDNTWKE